MSNDMIRYERSKNYGMRTNLIFPLFFRREIYNEYNLKEK